METLDSLDVGDDGKVSPNGLGLNSRRSGEVVPSSFSSSDKVRADCPPQPNERKPNSPTNNWDSPTSSPNSPPMVLGEKAAAPAATLSRLLQLA